MTLRLHFCNFVCFNVPKYMSKLFMEIEELYWHVIALPRI